MLISPRGVFAVMLFLWAAVCAVRTHLEAAATIRPAVCADLGTTFAIWFVVIGMVSCMVTVIGNTVLWAVFMLCVFACGAALVICLSVNEAAFKLCLAAF